MRTTRTARVPLNPVIEFFVHFRRDRRGIPKGRRSGPAWAMAAILVIGLSPAAQAGIADTPLPQFSDGAASVSVLQVPGVVSRSSVETLFFCTSLSAANVNVGVELFDSAGSLINDVNAGNGALLNVNPGKTVTFATGATASYLETQVITLPTGLTIAQGSARIVATSSQVHCNVMILDKVLTPPVSLATLGSGVQLEATTLPASLSLPVFSDGKAATHSALFPGVISRQVMETTVFCTSLAATNIDVGVEVVDTNGVLVNSVNAGNGAIVNVAPGSTVTFSTGATSTFFENSIISITGAVDQGSIRTVSNSGQLICSAVFLDAAPVPATNPASAMSNLAGDATNSSRANVAITSPLPQFSDGKQSVSIATVSGVLKRDELQTLFLCTSVDSAPVDIGVQIFDGTGVLINDINAGVGAELNVAPGATVTIATSTTAAYLETSVIPTQNKLQGLGRIVASSDQVRCNTVVVDDLTSPPATAMVIGDAVRPALGPLPSTVALPQFSDGTQATHAAYFPGAVKRGDVETDVFCTSTASGPIDIGVQFFFTDSTIANDVTAGNGAILNVAPGNTIAFGTTGTASLFENQVVTFPGLAAGFVLSQALVRVVSNSDQLICSALVLDAGSAGATLPGGKTPGSMSALVGLGLGAGGAAACGDNILQPGEQCDGTANAACGAGRTCGANCLCQPAVCGDGFVQAGEQCDDGGTVNGDCCSSTCQFEAGGSSCSDGDACNGVETCDGAGTCAAGTPINCDDGDACTQDICDGATGLCTNDAAPATSCLTALKSSFQVKDHPTKPVDQIKWKWTRGQGFVQGAIGNPNSVATYAVCVYDMTGAVPRVAASLTLPPQFAWLNKDPKGWQYKDKLGSVDGIQQIKIKPGLDGKTKFQMKARGPNLPTPAPFSATKFFDQNPDVTVQVFNDQTPTCWTSSFTTAKKNTVSQFKAKSP